MLGSDGQARRPIRARLSDAHRQTAANTMGESGKRRCFVPAQHVLRSLIKKAEPYVEILGPNFRDAKVHLHRIALIRAFFQHHIGPEITDLGEMRRPVGVVFADMFVKDRA